MIFNFKKILRAYDYPIFIAVVLLSLFGLVMVYSASMITAVSHYRYPIDYFFQNQKSALILSFIMMVIAMILPYKLYKHKTFLMVMMGGSPSSSSLCLSLAIQPIMQQAGFR
ncbi:FtsW/RodA/SpoVE family cell cycle protein [Peribacillus frigoritolerans]|uniref:FtsW/RodA/SpoVE family cell cycle protein n=1 Tax=Peribacillus frigoritolerans TaxID=450367 RepID=UPI002B24E8C4|nr:FtsW/RodA/SpoVE family cell cycle protein [Peribacillus frigoritolerans]MEB2493723.1 FtsW/RodA/SpoVE family cell cycle protein [Peribacillus frigoritolerans]